MLATGVTVGTYVMILLGARKGGAMACAALKCCVMAKGSHKAALWSGEPRRASQVKGGPTRFFLKIMMLVSRELGIRSSR